MGRKISKKISRSRKEKYDLTTFEERCKILQMRETGATSRQIAEVIKKNMKTVQSVKTVIRKSEYSDFKKAIIEFGFEMLSKTAEIGNKSQKELQKNGIQDTSKFLDLIPKQKQNSQRRRVYDNISKRIADQILSMIENQKDENHQLIKESEAIHDLYTPKLVYEASSDSLGEEQGDLSGIQSNDGYHYDQRPDLSSLILRLSRTRK